MSNYRGFSQSALQYLAENQSVTVAHLVELELPTTQGGSVSGYFTDFGTPINYNGRTYQTNRIKKITDIKEEQNIKVNSINIEVAGEWQDELDRALKEPTDVSYVYKNITVLRAFLDENGNIIDMDEEGGPIKYFKGIITDISVKEGVINGSSVVTWQAANHFSYFEKVTGRLAKDSAHRGLVSQETSPGVYEDVPNPTVARKASHTSDLGFMHAEKAIEVEAQYKATERRYKMVKRGGFAGLVGMERLQEYEVEVDREIDLRFNLTPSYLPKVYGVRRLGLNPVFAGVDAADPSEVYVVYTVCEGEIDGFLNLYIANKSIMCGQPDAQEESETTICIGSQRSGHTLETSAEGGTGTVGAPSIHGTKYVIEDETGTLNITVYHGKDNQTADPDLVNIAANQGFLLQGDTPGEEYWGTNHRLLDTAYIVVNTKLNEDKTEIPEIEVVVQGQQPKIWDAADLTPTGGLQGHTLNMAWQLLDYITSDSGGQIDISEVDIESFWRVAQHLDVEDTSYDISWVPYWRYIGWENLATSRTDPFGNVLPTRTKYQCNTLLNTDQSAFKNIKTMLAQVKASLNFVGGKYVLSIENDDAPIQDYQGNNTVIDWRECRGNIRSSNTSSKNSWNTIDARISDTALGFSQNNVIFFDSDFKEYDNNIEKKGRLDFNFITNYYTARSIAAFELKRSRYARTFNIETYFKYSYLNVNDNVEFYYPRFFGETPKKMRVSAITVKSNGFVDIQLTDYDKSIYDQITQSDRSDVLIPPAIGVRAPTNLEILPDWTLGDTPPGTSLLLKWTPSVSEPISRYEFRWYIGPTGSPADQISSIQDVLPRQIDVDGKVYAFATGIYPRDDNWTFTFDVRTVLADGSYSRWVSATLDSTDPLYPDTLPEITNFEVTNRVPGVNNQFFGASINFRWDNHVLPTNAYELVIYNPANEAEEYSQWIIARPSDVSKAEFSYTINRNLADHQAVEGSLGIYRDIGAKVRARSDPSLTPGKQLPGYSQEGFGPWAYIEI